MVKFIKRAVFIIMLTTLLGSHMTAMHQSICFRVCNVMRHKMTQKTMRKDTSLRYGVLNVDLIKIDSFIFVVSRGCVIEFRFYGM